MPKYPRPYMSLYVVKEGVRQPEMRVGLNNVRSVCREAGVPVYIAGFEESHERGVSHLEEYGRDGAVLVLNAGRLYITRARAVGRRLRTKQVSDMPCEPWFNPVTPKSFPRTLTFSPGPYTTPIRVSGAPARSGIFLTSRGKRLMSWIPNRGITSPKSALREASC